MTGPHRRQRCSGLRHRVLARIVAGKPPEQWTQPAVVENRPGRGGSLGAQTVMKLPADGDTLRFSAMAAFAINPQVYQRVGCDPMKDFSPITAVARPQGVLYVNADLPVKNVDEVLRYGKARPGMPNDGSAGSGLDVMNTSAAEFGTMIARDHERLGRLVKSLKLTVD